MVDEDYPPYGYKLNVLEFFDLNFYLMSYYPPKCLLIKEFQSTL